MSLEALAIEVVSRPTSEEVRLAYADAVEAVDPDRAELIRLQVLTARNRRTGVDNLPYSGREAALLDTHARRWAEPVAQYVSGYRFLRGFVEQVAVDAEWFLETADELYWMAPILHLDLVDAKPVAEELFRSEWVYRIVSMSCAGSDFGDAEATMLAGSPHLQHLEWLDLSHNHIGRDGLEALAASPNLPQLGFVDLRDNAVDDPTPQHADEYDATSPAALSLIERYGHREWLDARPRYRWPPERDATWVELA